MLARGSRMKSAPTTRDQIERGMLLVKRSLAYWGRALLVFVVGVALAVPFVFTRPRVFKSEEVILYHETIRSSDLTGGEGQSENTARRVGARLREVLMARASLEPIITDNHLFAKPGQTLDRRDLVDAVDDMRKRITFRAREGDTFEISYQGGTAQEAQEVTRRLGECIVQEAATRRSEGANALKEFLQKESDQNNAKLRIDEAEFAKFTSLHPALAARLQGQNPTPSGPQRAASTPSDPILAGLESRAARIDRQLRAAAGQPPPPPKPVPVYTPPPDSPELIAARKDLADKQARYTDKHPDVAAARTRLRTAEAAQAAAVASAEAAHAAAVAAAQVHDDPPPKNAADEDALKKELAELQNQIAWRRAGLTAPKAGADASAPPAPSGEPQLGGDVALEVEFRRLQREVNEGRERQRQLDEKMFKASMTASSVMNDRNVTVSVLDPAYLPTGPISKSRTSLLATLLIVCAALAFGTALLFAKLDDRIYDSFDLNQLDVLPVLGSIPRAPHQLPPKR